MDDIYVTKKIVKNNILPKFIIDAFFVDIKFNELNLLTHDYLSTSYNPNKLQFVIIANNFCNFKCNYCYEVHDEKEISQQKLDLLLSAIDNYHRQNKLTKVAIEWYGGEPLLSIDNIEYFTKKLNKYCNENNISVIYSMTTNGYLLSKEIVKKLLDLHINSFQVTIAGGSKLHNKLRPLKNGDATWDVIIYNLLEMSKLKRDFHVMVRVNFTYETLSDINELLDFMAENFDKDRFSVFFHHIADWGGQNKEYVIDDDLITYLQCDLIDMATRKGINVTRFFSMCMKFGHICYASMPYHFVVSWDGNLRKCTFDNKKDDYFNKVGSINKGYFEVNGYKNCNFVAPKFYYNEDCLKCDVLPICMNASCPKTNLKSGKGSCAMTKKLIDKIIESECKLYNQGSLTNISLVGLFD